MTTLKTLKDFEFIYGACGESGSTTTGMTGIDEVKQEAIKWIKALNNCSGFDGSYDNIAIKKWIKHFFNITEEDLKDEN